jgi:hypothetical protein
MTLRLEGDRLHIHDSIRGTELHKPFLLADPDFFAQVRKMLFDKIMKEAQSRIRSARSVIAHRKKLIEQIREKKKEPVGV